MLLNYASINCTLCADSIVDKHNDATPSVFFQWKGKKKGIGKNIKNERNIVLPIIAPAE